MRKELTMTVLTPSRETELDVFDLDVRVVPAGDAQDAAADAAAMPTAPGATTPCICEP
jgi:hypothetical protein